MIVRATTVMGVVYEGKLVEVDNGVGYIKLKDGTLKPVELDCCELIEDDGCHQNSAS